MKEKTKNELLRDRIKQAGYAGCHWKLADAWETIYQEIVKLNEDELRDAFWHRDSNLSLHNAVSLANSFAWVTKSRTIRIPDEPSDS
tara:strand:- start:967 stop:1227 length:261 start_codon:yes stop_codon:yes gene_type:complete